MTGMRAFTEMTTLSDDDLRHIWLENELESIDRARSQGRQYVPRHTLIFTGIIGIAFAILLFTFEGVSALTVISLFGVVVLAVFFIGSGWAQRERARRRATLQAKRLNLDEASTMREVVEAICLPSIRHATDLRRQIDHDMRVVRYAREDLEKLCCEAEIQMHSAATVEGIDLLSGRKKDAESAIGNLQTIQGQLAAQREAVDDAVRPVEDLYGKFITVWKVTRQLERIQQAHRLTEDVLDRVEVRRKEVDQLYRLTGLAEGRLQDLARTLEAERQARSEVRQLIESGSVPSAQALIEE